MKLLFMGTGTSYGIPVPGCECPVCTSGDPRDRRLRTSILVTADDGTVLLLDTPPDLRTQCLRHGVKRIDGVLISHDHADHVFGFDDLRAYTNRMPAPMPVWTSPRTAESLRRVFDYLGRPPLPGTSLARVELREVEAPFAFGPFAVTPLPVEHGRSAMTGWRIEADGRSCVLITDCKRIPETTWPLCLGADLAVLDGLRPELHATHLSIAQAGALLQRMGAKRSYIIHMCHAASHVAADALLPEGIHPAYDGLEIRL